MILSGGRPQATDWVRQVCTSGAAVQLGPTAEVVLDSAFTQ